MALTSWIRKLFTIPNAFRSHRTGELEMLEALKPLLPDLLGKGGPVTRTAPRLPKEAARFIEFFRDTTVLSIDLYQRFKPVADRINALAEEGLTVLDVGGREWTFSAFLPRHRVVVADLLTTGTDARALPYSKNSFDVATAHHLLEHVPSVDQVRVVGELIRVARRRVFVTGPFEENPFAQEIDTLLASLDPDNQYLRDHAQFGLPSLQEIENWLSAKGLRYRVEPLTRCNTWLLALALTPLQQTNPRVFREITRFYNQRFSEFDRCHPSYQTLIEIELDS